MQLIFSFEQPYFEISFLILTSSTVIRLASDRGVPILYPFSNRVYSLNIYRDINELNVRGISAYFGQKKVIFIELSLLFTFLYYAKVNILLNYFIFMTVSSTLIPLPSDTAVVAAGASHIADFAVIAILGGVGSTMGSTVDYYIGMNLTKNTKFYKKIEPYLDRFKKRAFFWIVFGGFTPLPFEPFRLIAGYVNYDIKKYWLAVFLSRAPRFYLLAWFGYDILNQIAYYFLS
ncbi:MAG: VTT domain-containing protein [Candidatus Methanoperedens sp.]|nr:VTT domain-containing protein [Candidatus Methanoperedens nitroreducens]MDJ1421735.1 VTT domain-containing protein [Candidatus Methanoperedens sp.]